jgi:hypothetical protein
MNSPRAVEERRSTIDRELDETLEASLPASDAAANTVVTGRLPVLSSRRTCANIHTAQDAGDGHF